MGGAAPARAGSKLATPGAAEWVCPPAAAAQVKVTRALLAADLLPVEPGAEPESVALAARAALARWIGSLPGYLPQVV